MAFTLNEVCSQEEVRLRIGGGQLRSYLPTQGRRVLAARLRLDLNPRAPHIIVVGDGPCIVKAAEWLAVGKYAIPIFLKEGTNKLKYAGDFRCVCQSCSVADLKNYGGHRSDVTSILFMESE